IHHLDQAESDPRVQMNEGEMLMQWIGQPFERIARAPGEQRVRDLLGRRELRGRNALELTENPALKRALALPVLVGESELKPILTRAGPAAEDFPYRKQIERALLHLRRELLEPLGCGLCRAQARRKGEGRNEYPDFSFRHSQPPVYRRSRRIDSARSRDRRVQRPFQAVSDVGAAAPVAR